MAKPFVIKNKRSLNGETTTPVIVTIKSWQKLVAALEGKYYSFKDTYLEDIVNSMSYEEQLQMKRGLLRKQNHLFTENEKIVDKVSEFDKNEGRKHKLYGITNADLEVFLFLHKNVIHMVSFRTYRSTCYGKIIKIIKRHLHIFTTHNFMWL